MATPERGITVFSHVDTLLAEAETKLATSALAIRRGKLQRADRERLGRALAGVIGTCETVRIWLAAGAPR